MKNQAFSSITCPTCSASIELTEVLRNEISRNMRNELELEFRLKNETDLARIETTARQKIEELEKLRTQEKEEYEQQRQARDIHIRKAEEQKAREDMNIQLRLIEEEAQRSKERQISAEEKLLEALNNVNILQEERRNTQADIQRQIVESQTRIAQEIELRYTEQMNLKEKEYELKQKTLQQHIEELQRAGNVGSQQLQGETLEVAFEESIRKVFVYDSITEVGKGVRGADLVQSINSSTQRNCGTILWELKSVKTWNKEFITKLKDDMQSANANVGIIVTTTLPTDIQRFGLVNGVWITDRLSALPLASALRDGLIALDRQAIANEGRDEKMALLYQYLTSSSFNDKFIAMADIFKNLHDDLAREKQAMYKLWGRREKQIDRMFKNLGGIRGELEGIIGGNELPYSPLFELPVSTDDQELS